MIVPDPGSFRDPAGRVYIGDDQVYRSVSRRGVEQYVFLRDTGLLKELAADGSLLPCDELPGDESSSVDPSAAHVLRQPKLRFISYPYEWPFSLLKKAALFHLDLHLRLLDRGATLSDASAYNIQFVGTRPVFIDVLSMRRYREGDFWPGHRQFCEQFLHPLLLQSIVGVGFNGWYRGAFEGIPGDQLAKALPMRRKLSWRIMTQVLVPAALQRKAAHADPATLQSATGIFPRNAFIKLLRRLRGWIAELRLSGEATTWSNYEATRSYSGEQQATKNRLVKEFIAKTRPPMALDLGCNAGEHSLLALDAGAGAVVGVDTDIRALEMAIARSDADCRNLLPLLVDLANPSPSQGWNGLERSDFGSRAQLDAVLALAVHHHLSIGRNVPPDRVIDWIVARAPVGLIEFIPKSDPMVCRMLSLREDVFAEFNESDFAAQLRARVRIVREDAISPGGRRLYWFER